MFYCSVHISFIGTGISCNENVFTVYLSLFIITKFFWKSVDGCNRKINLLPATTDPVKKNQFASCPLQDVPVPIFFPLHITGCRLRDKFCDTGLFSKSVLFVFFLYLNCWDFFSFLQNLFFLLDFQKYLNLKVVNFSTLKLDEIKL
jgi:hypothetical protein